MKAAIFRKAQTPLSIEDVELGHPRAGEARIRVVASGLCHSDLHFITGDIPLPAPMILGHEVAGIIEAVGEDVRGFRKGDKVVACLSAFCGECGQCQGGNSQRCDVKPGRSYDPADQAVSRGSESIYRLSNLGGFAEEMIVHQRSLVKLPEGVPMTSAALMGCGVMTGVGAVLNGAEVKPGSTVAVIGCGGVGLNMIQGARIAGAARIIAVDLYPTKLDLARSLGATDVVVSSKDSIAEVLELTKGGVDYAFEAVGLPETIGIAVGILRKGGTAALIGLPKAGAEFSVPIGPIVMNETRIIGSLMGSTPFQLFLPKLAQYYLTGELKLDELVSRRLALEDINDGFAAMASGIGARNVIVFDG